MQHIKPMGKTVTLLLKPGDPAPLFDATSSEGGRMTLADLRGKTVVLYFYPRDATPGCTREACGFRDQFEAFQSKGVVVLGVSTDSEASHDRFARKHNLPFPLLADEDKSIVSAYGVWGPKTFMGRSFMGIHRVTFLIGPDGIIKKIWTGVKPDGHAEEVLREI